MQKKYDMKEIQKLCSDYCSIGQILGEGSFGVVFKATLKTKRKSIVALKCMNKNMLLNESGDIETVQQKSQIIDEEVNIMINCNNINILKCFNTIEDDKYRILFLKYCEGGDLYHKILRQGKIKQREAIKILAQILVGFASLHKIKVIHRDFKTDNIIIRKGVYKIGDFGTAKKIQHLLKSRKGTLVGSRITMSPQVIEGKQYGIQSDMWSLGIVYFEMLFGKLPFLFVINDSQIKKLWDFLQVQSCSIQSKNLLKRILVINPNQRLKWIQIYKMYNNRQEIFSQQMFNPTQIKTDQSDYESDDFYQLKYGGQYDVQYPTNQTFYQKQSKLNLNRNENHHEQHFYQDFNLYQDQDKDKEEINYDYYQWTQQDQKDKQCFVQDFKKILKKSNKKSKNKNKQKYEKDEKDENKINKNDRKIEHQINKIENAEFKQINQMKFTRLRALLLHYIVIISEINLTKLQMIEKLNVVKLQILINQDARNIMYSKRQYIEMNSNLINYSQNKLKQEILKYQQAARLLIEQRNSLFDRFEQILFQCQRKNKNQQKIKEQRQKRIKHQNTNSDLFNYSYLFSNYMFDNSNKKWSTETKPLYFFEDHLLKKLKLRFSHQMSRKMEKYVGIVKFYRQASNKRYIEQQSQIMGLQ